MLYYPGSRPPKKIVRQAVLYWDFIASITDPHHVAEMPGYMKDTLDAGLYHPIFFAQAGGLHAIFMQAFRKDFHKLLTEVPVSSLLPDERIRDFTDHEEDLEIQGSYSDNWMSGHSDHRFPGPLMANLMRQGFISVRHEIVNNWPADFYILAPRLKFLLFATAARAAAAHVEGAGLPATAKGKVFPHTELQSAHLAGQYTLPGIDSTPAWRVEVGRLLPNAGPENDIGELIRFRQAHEDERRRLMDSIDRLSRKLKVYYPEPQEALAETREEIEKSIADFQKAARSRRLSLVPKSLTMTVAIGASAAGHYLAPGFDWLLGGVAASMAVNILTGSARMQADGEMDVSYLHQMKKTLDIS